MEITKRDDQILLDKELNALDRFVIDFTTALDKEKIAYVIISGYVAILFGRNRASEDVDIFIERISKEAFIKLWERLSARFECIIPNNPEQAYSDYLLTGHAIRFAHNGTFIPNMEIKFTKTELDEEILETRQKVLLNKGTLFTSKIEPQIAFKLFLGSEKDIEDAVYLHQLFKDQLDQPLFKDYCRKLKVEPLVKEYLS